MKPFPSLLSCFLLFVSAATSSAEEAGLREMKDTHGPVQRHNGSWMFSFRTVTIPGVRYNLEASDSLEAGSWDTVQSIYGSGAEWIAPLVSCTAPSSPPAGPQPVIPELPAEPLRFAFLFLQESTDGTLIASWRSLDDSRLIRKALAGITLDPVWDTFNSGYPTCFRRRERFRGFRFPPLWFTPVFVDFRECTRNCE